MAPALDQIVEIEQLHADAQAPSGSVRVTAMAGLFEFFQMDWLAEFYARYPNISVDFLLDDTVSDLVSDSIDLALRMGIETGTGFKVRRIAPSAMILAANPSYLERHPGPRTLRELAEQNCLTISNRNNRNTWRLQGPRGSQEVAVKSRLAVNDMRVLVQACVAGLGIALLPQLMIEPLLEQGKLVRVLPTYRRASTGTGLQLVYTSRPPVSPRWQPSPSFSWKNWVTRQASCKPMSADHRSLHIGRTCVWGGRGGQGEEASSIERRRHQASQTG